MVFQKLIQLLSFILSILSPGMSLGKLSSIYATPSINHFILGLPLLLEFSFLVCLQKISMGIKAMAFSSLMLLVPVAIYLNRLKLSFCPLSREIISLQLPFFYAC